jgi:predicted transcriptional regulator
MPFSKLKLYIDIVKSLMEYGPLSLDEMAPFLRINPSSLKERVNFLVDQEMIQEKDSNSIVTYIITKRGARVLEFFKIQPSTKVSAVLPKPNNPPRVS